MILKAHELRIGSLVTVTNPEYHPKLKGVVLRVTSISPNGDDYSIGLEHINQKPNTYYETYSQFLRFIEPVPITGEMLDKAGFEYDDKCNECTIFDGFEFTIGKVKDSNYWFSYNVKMDGGGYFQYFHELQNIISGLIGREFTFKL